MYFDFEEIGSAYKVFDEMIDRDVVIWNSMIGGCVKCGRVQEARELFEMMNVSKNVGSYNAMLGGYVRVGCIERARELFDEMPERDVVSWNIMIGAQARLGTVEIACELFDYAPKKNVTTWSTIISGFCHSGCYNDALDKFKKMLVDGPRPNQAVLVCALSSCAHLGALELGVWVHGYIVQSGFKVDDWLGSSLIDMYAKCGVLQAAISLFHRLKRREACAWTSMIHGYAIHGQCQQALDTFNKMEELRIKPNDVTFVAILSACSHAGLVDKGREIFKRMKQVCNMSPKIEHYTCMIDLFCRSNLLDEAQELVKSMPMKPDIYVWGALISGLRIHQPNSLKLDNGLRGEIERLRPTDSGLYVLLSNIYAGFDQWGEVEIMRGMMKDFGVKKSRGWSSIEVEGVVHVFLAGQREGNYYKLDQAYEMLDCVYKGTCISYFA
ncbi:pentatricopeptide repeat-containing protein At3g29230-like [Asparagus officinalis]|nr:pentatricopeptide repeat-containing protein At3g29230-like [Asparagus officinalis]